MATLSCLVSSPTLLTFRKPPMSKHQNTPFFKPNSSALHKATLNHKFQSTKPRSSLPPLNSSQTSITSISSPPSLKTRLKNGETLYGIFLFSFSPTIAEIVGLAGYDFVVVDMEHGYGGIPEALHCLRALAASHTPAILRLPDTSECWAKKALDLGPQGIMFPMIDNAKAAREAVSYCRFQPRGIRGSAHTFVRDSDYGIDENYLSNYEDELLIMCQIESQEAVEKIEEIATVDGVDCLQLGPRDLSASMGYLWNPSHEKVREMVRKAEKGVLGSGGGAYLGGIAMLHDCPENLRSRGYKMVTGGIDIGMFRRLVVEDVKKFKLKERYEDNIK